MYSCLLLMLCNLTIHAQTYWDNIDFYTTKDGLPNNSILSLHQDNKGFLWIGTFNGLCRYDGREFKTYTDAFLSKEKNWIASVNCITEDNSGNIWIGTRGGLIARFNVQKHKWDKHHKSAQAITTLYCDSQNTIWVGTAKGQFGSLTGDSFTLKQQFTNPVTQIIESQANTLVLNSTSIYTYNIIKNTTTLFNGIPAYHQLEDVALHPKCLYFFKIDKTVSTYTLTEKTPRKNQSIAIQHNIFKSKSGFTKTGNLLFEAENKLYEINAEANVVDITDLNPVTSSLKNQYINFILEDYSGLIWIGTNTGLFKINKNNIQFKNKTTNNSLQKIKHNYIRALHNQNNTLWLGTKEGELGKLVFDTVSGTTISQTWFPAKRINATTDFDFTINTIETDDDGDLWAGGTEGLFYMPKGHSTLQQMAPYTAKGKEPVNQIWSLKAIKNLIFIGTIHSGLLVYNKTSKTYSKVLLNGAQCTQPIWTITPLKNNTLWVGTAAGIYSIVYDTAKNTYALLPPKVEGGVEFAGREIWGIVEEAENIWLGSTENGLTQLNKKTKKITHYKVENGLTENVISGLVADGNGNIWVSTIGGLNKINIATKKVTVYTEDDGLLSNDFNFGAATMTPWGEIFLGTKVGLTSFFPDKINNTRNNTAKIEITNIKIKGEDHPFKYNEPLQLQHSQNYISFRFAVLEFSKPSKHTYKYQLKGFEQKWQEASYDNPVAVYTNLPPGNYTFIVKGSADGKTWDGQANILIHIQPALWQQPLFWILILLIIVILIILLVRQRIKAIVQKEREKAQIVKAMAELEMKALRAQMNPHFIFNTIAAIQHYIVKEDTLQANEYLAKFAKLMRLFLESSRSNYILLSDEIQLLNLYLVLEKLRFEDKFDYWLTVDPNINTNELKIPSMLLQPFVENAINHGLMHRTEKGWLKIEIQYNTSDEKLTCTINDNGVGRKKAGELRHKTNPTHKSQGVKLIDERVEALFGLDDVQIEIDIEDKIDNNGIPLGTLVKLVIPIKKSKSG